MSILGVIPARLDSKRLPKKLLRSILGKPLLQWTWEAVKKSRFLDRVVIAADSKEIIEAAQSFGAEAILTSPAHNSGTERIAEVILRIEADIVINIQADEPLMKPQVIDNLVLCMQSSPDIEIATVIKRIYSQDEVRNPDIVKVVIDKLGFALYFSRSPIPFIRDKETSSSIFYKHLGIYAYRLGFLKEFGNLPESYLEEAEKLEQLRFLFAGKRIKTVITNIDTIGVDTEGDLKKVEEALKDLRNKG